MNFDQLSVHELAAAIVSTDDPRQRDACFERLVKKISKRVRYRAFLEGWRVVDQDDFESELTTALWASLKDRKFDPTKARFWTWFGRFLHSRCVDAERRGRRWRRITLHSDWNTQCDANENPLDNYPDKSSDDSCNDEDFSGNAESLETTEREVSPPLPQVDLAQLETWQTRDRVLVLAKIGWLSRVPLDVREQWFAELKTAELKTSAHGTFAAFPTDLPRINRWLEYLLGMTSNGLARRWNRQQERLVELVSFWVVLHQRGEPWSEDERKRRLDQSAWHCLVVLVVSGTWKRLDGPQTWAGVQWAVGKKFHAPVLSLDRMDSAAKRLECLDKLAGRVLRPPPSVSAVEAWNQSADYAPFASNKGGNA